MRIPKFTCTPFTCICCISSVNTPEMGTRVSTMKMTKENRSSGRLNQDTKQFVPQKLVEMMDAKCLLPLISYNYFFQ